jgi:hypothetical protein
MIIDDTGIPAGGGPLNRARTTEYSGAPFGRPGDVLPPLPSAMETAAVTYLRGADSITAAAMPPDLDVYCGYLPPSSFANLPDVEKTFPGKRYVGFTPSNISSGDCLDVEPGDASPAECPGFVLANPRPPHVVKPMIYASAGDVAACVDELSSAGISRARYFIFSAHWIGRHVCAPGICGYPQADQTQYANAPGYDSDVFAAYVFAPAVPAPLPGIPAGLRADPLSTICQVNVAWDEVTVAGVQHVTYQTQIERSADVNQWEPGPTIATDSPFATFANLSPRSKYRWRVSGGNWSEWQEITTP